MKRSANLLLLCLALAGCGGEKEKTERDAFTVIVVTDEAGLNDQGFNAVCWKGAERARDELGVAIQFKEPGDPSNYESFLDQAAQEADVVVSLGAMIAPTAQKVAGWHPDVHFIQIEGAMSEVPKNVQLVNFRSEQGGFLAGIVASLFTVTGKVGIVAGDNIPPVEAYIAGFEAGVRTLEANTGKNVTVEVLMAGTFADPVRGHELARQLIAGGCDVIFRCAGHTGQGVLKAVEETPGIYLIGEDLDIDDAIPGRVLTSTLKRMDLAVFRGIEAAKEGEFQGGRITLDAADDCIDITDMRHTRDKLDDNGKRLLDAARKLLKDADIELPTTREAAKEFDPPML